MSSLFSVYTLKRLKNFILILSLSFGLLFTHISKVWAEPHVYKKKNDKVILVLDDLIVSPDEQLFAVDESGRKQALIQVLKIKGNKALGQVLKKKSEVQIGWTLIPRHSQKKKQQTPPSQDKEYEYTDHDAKNTERSSRVVSSGKSYWGVMGGMALNTMQANNIDLGSTTIDTEMKGTGYSVKTFFDYALWPQISFRGLAGLEQFIAKSSGTCLNSEQCSISINYLSLDMWGRLLLVEGTPYNPWIGIGFSLMLPSSKQSSAIDPATITTTSVFGLSAGIDWRMSPKLFLPFQVEYQMYPASADVKSSTIAFRAGVGFSF